MAVHIRLQRHGKIKRPFYRLVAADHQKKRDGRYIEVLGTLNPMVEPPILNVKEDRIRYWIDQGAQPTETAAALIKKNIPGALEARIEHQRKRIQDRRKQRKERLAK